MRSVMEHSFSRAPTADIQRSSFNRSHGHKTTFDAGLLVPIYVDEALPGDTFSMDCSAFARLATPIHPIMDNMFMDIHFFSVPLRQIWDNFRRFMGERPNPDDSIDFTVPVLDSVTVTLHSVHDYMGIPPQAYTAADNISALPFRAYNHIYNEWYRDQNLIDAEAVPTGDGPDSFTNFFIQRRGKRHDYFTSCLPWPQKGDESVLPLGTDAPVVSDRVAQVSDGIQYGDIQQRDGTGGNPGILEVPTAQAINGSTPQVEFQGIADLSAATATTINQIREAFQIQKLLERDARSGTRYAEIVKAHFGVDFYDPAYRPEYLGGASVPVNIHPVPQTGETGTTAQGNLAAFGTTGVESGGFTKSFTEHCIVMGICSVRADLTYQQGVERMFFRQTRYDFYWPALSHLGEQEVLTREIFMQGSGNATDLDVFGYQERYAEYRYKPSRISGEFRSDLASSLDTWHLAQDFNSVPTLNPTFIRENPPLDRCIAVPSEPHFIADFYFNLQCARPMPLFAVPGLMDHF